MSAAAAGKTGAIDQVSADIGGNVFVAMNKTDNYDTDTWARRTDFGGGDFGIHADVGAGVHIQGFWNKDWQGISIGATVGVGEGATFDTVYRGVSFGWQLTPSQKTSQRSTWDALFNAGRNIFKLL